MFVRLTDYVYASVIYRLPHSNVMCQIHGHSLSTCQFDIKQCILMKKWVCMGVCQELIEWSNYVHRYVLKVLHKNIIAQQLPFESVGWFNM